MESAAHDPQQLACTEEGHGPGEHLPRCPARERQQQEALGLNALLDEPGDAGSQSLRLAGAGAGDDQQWPFRRRRGGSGLGRRSATLLLPARTNTRSILAGRSARRNL
jgi:hypothetical protein